MALMTEVSHEHGPPPSIGLASNSHKSANNNNNAVEMNALERDRMDADTAASAPQTEVSHSTSDASATQHQDVNAHSAIPDNSTRTEQSPTTTTTPPISTTQAASEPLSSMASTTETTITATTTDAPQTTPRAYPRKDSIAIGPETDAALSPPAVSSTTPACVITLLLTSGARHPYKLDERYLSKRNVDIPGLTENGKKDPFSISVYTLKELILREWRDEWETQPSSPSSIRLIHFGRLLDDKTPLKDCKFNADSPNVVHMTVKPQDMVDDEEGSKGKASGRDRDGNETTTGCRCVIL
ncbi:MAG: hypothetical protein M1818_006196 [Claussenomyces sp. TS43310]|nr:MAG: hypothetical protein M1818_006196 [Claussenomyces sp. TS43310]